MDKEQRRVFRYLLAISAAVFLIFLIPDGSGAADPGMLAVFEVDEYAQYPHLVKMLTPGATLYQSLRNFTVYEHYFYGYPFYFFSAVAVLPLKLALGASWQEHTRTLVTALRLLVNVLPMVGTLLLLVWIQTRFRTLWKAAGLFILLLCVPGVVVNNLWWHPDSLAFFFVILTLYFLDRDDLRFGRNFFLAAAACGLAAGTKYLGLFYVLAVPLYLIWGMVEKRIRPGRAALLGLGFVAVMAAAIVISNPLLLLPQERAEIIAVQKLQMVQTGKGIFLANPSGLLESGYPEDIRVHYGELYFLVLGFASLCAGLARPEHRRLNALILAWMIPFTAVILASGTRRTHYFLPVLIPLFSTINNLFPDTLDLSRRNSTGLKRALAAALGLAVVTQAALFVRTDMQIVKTQLAREENSASLKFTEAVRDNVLSKLPETPSVIYRDWRVYFPASAGQQVEMNWELASYPYIEALKPDLILLEHENTALYSQPFVVEQAVDSGDMAATHAFYGDAANGRIRGYAWVYTDNFGSVFVAQDLAKYFTKH